MKQFILQIISGLLVLLSICQIVLSVEQMSRLNIVVIGAGPAGLVSAKHSIANGHNVTVFEQSEELGGLWVFSRNYFISVAVSLID